MITSFYNQFLTNEPARFSVGLDHYTFVGADSLSFLQNQVTSKIEINSNSFSMSCVLDGGGKIVTPFYYSAKSESEIHLWVFKRWSETLFTRLGQFLISEDVEIEKNGDNFSFYLNYYKGTKGRFWSLPVSLEKTNESIGLLEKSTEQQIQFFSGEYALESEMPSNNIINDTPYLERCVDFNKGCFLGQETVSKIESRRGAGLKWFLIEVDLNEEVSELQIENKKVKILNTLVYNNKNYIKAALTRDQRLLDVKIECLFNDKKSLCTIYDFESIAFNSSSYCEQVFDEAHDLYLNDKEDLALEKLLGLTDRFPNALNALELQAQIYSRKEDYKNAIRVLEKIEKQDPNFELILTSLSVAHMKAGNIEVAEDYKSKATLQTFEAYGKLASEKQMKQEQEEEQKRREEMFRQVLEIDPDDELANTGLAEIMVERENWKEAIPFLERSLSQKQKSPRAFLFMAQAKKELSYPSEEVIELLNSGKKVALSLGDMKMAQSMQRLLSSF